MPGFEVGLRRGMAIERTGVEEAGIEQTVGGVEHPDGDKHGQNGGDGEVDVVGSGDEPDPEGGHSRGIQREEMPEIERGAMLFEMGWSNWGQRWVRRDGRCERHLFILGARNFRCESAGPV